MNIRRMVGVAALGAAAASMTLVTPAGAQEPEAHEARSEGRALHLSLAGQSLTLGSTTAEVTSAPSASANGFGLATPVFDAGATAATVDGGDGQQGSTEQQCEAPLDQLPIPLLSLALACSSSIAEISGDTAGAAATGTVSDIAVNPVQTLLETPLADILAPVQDGLGTLFAALEPVTGPLADAGIDLQSTLDDLLDNLFQGADLVRITIGDTETTAISTAEGITSACVAEGARIDVLGAPALGIEPVVSIIVGEASTSVTATRDSGEATPTVSPSLVTIESALVPGGRQAVEIGQSIEIPLPEPLGPITIGAAAGASGTDDAGLTFAEASAVSLGVLTGSALQGGLELELASCASAAGMTVAEEPPAAPPADEEPPAAQPTLPTTGSDGPHALALGAAVLLAGAGLVLLRRTQPTA